MLPEVLIVHIKRFLWKTAPLKVTKHLQFDETLKLTYQDNIYEYRLSSVIVHIGIGVEDGHYVTYANRNGEWYLYDDEKVMKCDFHTVKGQQAYLMIYSISIPSIAQPAKLPSYIRGSKNESEGVTINHSSRNNHEEVEVPTNTEETGLLQEMAVCLKQRQTQCIVSNIDRTGVNCEKILVKGEDLSSLRQAWEATEPNQCWLNDVIINAYCSLITKHLQTERDVNIFPFSSLFMTNLERKGYKHCVTEWHKKLKLFENWDMWIIPIHKDKHWKMMVVDFKKKTIHFADSLHMSDNSAINLIRDFIGERYIFETQKLFTWDQWQQRINQFAPRQLNECDCGIFALKTAYCIANDCTLNFSQDDMPRFRYEMAYEIVSKKLLPNETCPQSIAATTLSRHKLNLMSEDGWKALAKNTVTANNQSQKIAKITSRKCKTEGRITCKEDKCDYKTTRLVSLQQHLIKEHGLNMDKEQLQFDNEKDFLQWKVKYEDKTQSWYVKSTGCKGKGATTTYYYCNRSGFYKKKGVGKRAIKLQGTSKVNTYCTSSIKATTQSSGKIQAEICKTHYGHVLEYGHLRLPEDVKLAVAHKLQEGVSAQHILDDIRDSVNGDFKRLHMMTKKDITNLEQTYHLNNHIKRHQDDAKSVQCWVKECEGTESNPVLLYKPQGIEQSGCLDNLSKDDFLLCLQTPLQAQLFKQLGNNSIVCIDSTHGTNCYEFTLVTVIVVDEFGEGYPAAWCISNREDSLVLEQFFKAIKRKAGSIVPHWFMSDDAEQFHNAWIAAFGPVKNKLLCSWHVDRAWRQKLHSTIKDREIQMAVYRNLRVIMEEGNVDEFEKLLNKTLQQLLLNEMTRDFAQYFINNYAKRKREWAYCYRRLSTINTNMYVEAFHHVLKYTYLQGKVNRRVDKCVHTLLKLARDKSFDRLIKISKGKITRKHLEIQRRHAASLKMDKGSVTVQMGHAKCCQKMHKDNM